MAADTDYDGVNHNTLMKGRPMQFSVIYSVDVPADTDVLDFAPPNLENLWDETEDDDQYEFGYLEGRWEGGHHRKWCAVLDREQFEDFVDRCGLTAESTETMGSLGCRVSGSAGPRQSRSTPMIPTPSSAPT